MKQADVIIARAIRRLLRERRAGASVCPSEVARALDPVGWRARMDDVRRVAAALADDGEVVVTQKGHEVDVRTARGPIRIARALGHRAAEKAEVEGSRPQGRRGTRGRRESATEP